MSSTRLSILLFALSAVSVAAQVPADATGVNNGTPDSKFEWSGYVDLYYSYYTDSANYNSFQRFSTVAPRSNEFSLNIAQVSFSYTGEKTRASATLHYGDIPSSSWSSTFNFIQQAYAGYKVNDKIWVDAGLFTTHIGTEALLPKDNKLSTLALGTYHEPYFQSGICIRYDPTERFSMALHFLNGYNNFLDNNKSKSIGLFAKFTPSEKVTVSYSNLLGRETSGNDNRFYNNFVMAINPLERLSLTIGGDYGMEGSQTMYSGMAIVRYGWSDKFFTTVRGEYFHDKDGFLSGQFQRTDDPLLSTGLIAKGVTLGIEYKPSANSYLRFESRKLSTPGNLEMFYRSNQSTNSRTEMVFTTGIWF